VDVDAAVSLVIVMQTCVVVALLLGAAAAVVYLCSAGKGDEGTAERAAERAAQENC